MTFNSSTNTYEFTFTTAMDLLGRRITISSEEGGAFNDFIVGP